MTGLSGSGTRMFASLVQALGISVGKNLNMSLDNDNIHFDDFPVDVRTDPYNEDHYKSFADDLKPKFKKSGYEDLNIFALKNPHNMHLMHHFIKFCELEKYELTVFHIIRNGNYMIKTVQRSARNHFSHYTRYQNRFTYEYSDYYKYLEFWCHINKELLELLTTQGVNKLVFDYDATKLNPEKTVKKICDKLNIMEPAYTQSHNWQTLIHSIKTHVPNKTKEDEIPAQLLNYMDEIYEFVD